MQRMNDLSLLARYLNRTGFQALADDYQAALYR